MIYLDNAATTWPKPERVYQAMDKFMRNSSANPGRAGHKMAIEAGELIFKTRELLASFFNANSSREIIFTSNATEALNLAIKGSLKVGDHVVTTTMAHNSILRPLKELERRGVELTIVKADSLGQIKSKQIKESLNNNTKLVIMDHGSNVTGSLAPIEEVGKLLEGKGIYFLVDAAQTAGVRAIDVQEMKIDMLAFTGHKGLFGPQGTGGLYLREDIALKPLMYGGTGSYSEDLYQPNVRPDRYESGTSNTPGIAGLKAGIEFILKEGIEKISKYEDRLTSYLIEKLKTIPQIILYGPLNIEERVSVISFNLGDEDSGEVGYILDKFFNIGVRTGLHCAPLAHKTLGTEERGTVRLSLGYFNTEEEIERTIKAIKDIVGKL
ncbi:aminotransferase class V-fold PLP-dependent enzyme [Halonatronum saccharophilum]|uniref:aminotransferase class V-fold PLP-dependent enzyme n=1 Tax=Halonatronum saccharophilum TaxID=150060 RepID=UPI0004802D14|nr:aminotransferase class V-fold PLP-dependent enzyme [Halonatronum saccharophilum]